MTDELITVAGLAVRYPTAGGTVVALDDIDLHLARGASIGLVGESGSGKTTVVNAISGALSRSKAQITGSVHIDGNAMLELSPEQLRSFRRETLGYIGQDPHAVLDPTMRVGQQLRHVIISTGQTFSDEDYRRHFGRVGLPNPIGVAMHYPHQLSGGMAQRVVIALALAHNPSVIVADEPTASLDSTLRTHILDLITALASAGGATLLMVSHDLAAIRQYCQLTAVMYGGRIVEFAPTASVFEHPQHPYSAALLAAAPGREAPGERLTGIPGTQQVRYHTTSSCVFADRCTFSQHRCTTQIPLNRVVAGHEVACHRADELTLAGGDLR